MENYFYRKNIESNNVIYEKVIRAKSVIFISIYIQRDSKRWLIVVQKKIFHMLL